MSESKIVGVLQFYDFPLWKLCFNAYCEFVDEIYIEFDVLHTSWETVNYIINHCKVKGWGIDYYMSNWTWRERLLRLLDGIKPDIVVALDIDEIFEDGMKDEIMEFWKSDKKAMMVGYNPCLTNDGRNAGVYPLGAHMKIFKWTEGLTYRNYKNYAQVTQYAGNPQIIWYARHKINHYCMWTKEMEEVKKLHIHKMYGLAQYKAYLKTKE